MNLSTVISAITTRGLKLHRTADELRIEGVCPPELADAIMAHKTALLPCASLAKEAKAIANSNCIRRQLESFAMDIVDFYAPKMMDDQLARAVDTQEPRLVAQNIKKVRQQMEAIEWACLLFPYAMEVEAKHAVAAGAAE